MPSGSSPAMLGCLAGIGAEQCWWVGDSRGHTCSPQPSPAACPALRHPGEQGRKAPAGLSPSNVGGKVHDTSPIMLNSYLFPFSGDMGSASCSNTVLLQGWGSEPLRVPRYGPLLITHMLVLEETTRNPFAVQNLTRTWYESERDLVFQMVMVCFHPEW